MNQNEIEQEIVEFAQTWAAAEVHGDTAYFARALADNFLGIGPLGFLLTKQDWVDRHQSGDLKYSALDLHEVTVRVYQGAAILVGRQTQQGTYRGNPITAQLRTTLIFVQQHGQWQLAGYHVSAIGQPPKFAQTMPAALSTNTPEN